MPDPTFEMPTSAPEPLTSDQVRQTCLAARMESVGLLAGAVAHDLNNILTAVLGFGTLLAEEVASSPDASSNAREVLAAGERAAALARQLLACGGRQVLAPEQASATAIIDGARARLQDTVGDRVELVLQTDASAPAIHIDADRLEDALVALARNAREAMPNGGRLSIEAGPVPVADVPAAQHLSASAYVRIRVSDTGCGIPSEIQDRIFEPFFTTKAPGQAVGLGLATVYGFITQSGGAIQVHSERGFGTAFTIDLPASESTGHAPAPRPLEAPAKGAGQTVLVVDDTDEVRALVVDMLRRAGYRVIVAASAADALYMAHIQRGPIHLLVTDVVMPGSSGVDLARELRHERRGLRVLYMSGFADKTVVREGVRDAGEAFLEKPFSRDQLLQKVASLLR